MCTGRIKTYLLSVWSEQLQTAVQFQESLAVATLQLQVICAGCNFAQVVAVLQVVATLQVACAQVVAGATAPRASRSQ